MLLIVRRNQTLQLVGERVAFDQFKDQEPWAVVFLKAVDGRDVRVIQRSE